MNTFELTVFIDSYFNKPFVWGVRDCAIYIKDYLEKVANKDLSGIVSHCWRSKFEAVKYLKTTEKDFISIVSESVTHLDIPNITQAKLGDVVFINFDGWVTAGVLYHSNRTAVFIEECGLKLVDNQLNDIIKIIRVTV